MVHSHDKWLLEDITAIFDGVFMPHYQTRLVRGKDEPLYRPADEQTPYHQIIFARGFYASALHEISHWCIAGAKRRQLEDYGYWYFPDGRNAQEQSAFEQAEIVPQALESLFADACGRTFHVSVDNLGGDVEVDRAAFFEKVNTRKQRFLQEGLPTRANALYVALTSFYQREESLTVAIAQGQAVLEQASVTVNV